MLLYILYLFDLTCTVSIPNKLNCATVISILTVHVHGAVTEPEIVSFGGG